MGWQHARKVPSLLYCHFDPCNFFTLQNTMMLTFDEGNEFFPALVVTQSSGKSGLSYEKFMCSAKCCLIGQYTQSWEMS